jgi:glycosyltransferase involved in cell wall biosynthesis
MKIDLVGPSYPFRGGISHYTTLLFTHLKKRHTTKFYSFKRQYPRFLFPGKTDRDDSLAPLKDEEIRPLLNSLNPFSWLRVAMRISKDKPDLTIFPWWVVFWAPQFLTIIAYLRMFSKTRILFVCHNVLEHEGHSFKYWLSKRVLRRGDCYIVHSGEERDRLVEAVGERPIAVCFHPTYEAFNEGGIPQDQARDRLGIAEDNVLLFFGFVREYKGLRYLLDALPGILPKIDVRLVIAGEFWGSKQDYLRQIDELGIGGKVTIDDRYIPNEEMSVYFCAADLVVLPYVSVTGSGLVQLALGFDMPVVVSRIGALSEVVQDKVTGFLVSPEAPDEIAEAVVEFFSGGDGRRAEMRAAIREDRARFSWDGLIEAIDDLGSRQG